MRKNSLVERERMDDFMNNKNRQQAKKTPKQQLELRYKSAVSNLLLVVFLTLINIVLLVTNGNSYFLFSAFLPYLAADYGMYFCGMYPPEMYADVEDPVFADKSLLVIMLAVAAVILLLYVLAYIFARKKKIGWLIFALVFFVIDTIAMIVFTGVSADNIFDLVIHAWVVVSMVRGIITYFDLKKQPAEELQVLDECTDESETKVDMLGNTVPLRDADMEIKARIFVEAEAYGHQIVFRRVKNVNELVIDGRVYDEYIATIEFEHTLQATLNGHEFIAQFDGKGRSFIFADGEQLAKKIRLV